MSGQYRGPAGDPEFELVARTSDLRPGMMKRVEVDRRDVLLVNLGGTFYAVDNNCPHNGGPLAQGWLKEADCQVLCPWHSWSWDLRTGRGISPPVNFRVATYEVRVEDDNVLVSRRPG